MTITLRNDFHNTSAKVREGWISRATVRRVRRALCGISDCKCSGELGTRGPQNAEILPDYGTTNRPYFIEAR